MMNKYIPIACEVYGNYELAILRHAQMRFCWHARGGIARIESLVPMSIRTHRQGEFIVLRNRRGGVRVVRLDHIISATLLRPKKQ